MKSIAALLFAGIAVAAAPGCGSATSPSGSTQPSSFTFTAALLPSNEVPAVSNAEASGTGTVTIVMNVTRDSAQSITAATMNFSVTLTGFPNNTTLTGAHIHQAAPGATAGVLVNTGLASGEVVLANGAGTFTKNNINVPVDQANNIIASPGGFYFNVHSTLNAGGFARGQLTKQ